MTDPIRLSKALAALLPCSRREAELYIEGGWVLVDGEVVDEPQFMVAEQKVDAYFKIEFTIEFKLFDLSPIVRHDKTMYQGKMVLKSEQEEAYVV